MARILEDQVAATEAVAGESKEEAFRRLATKRMNKALDEVRKIGNLSSRGNYEYTEEQVEKIEAALNEAVKFTMNKFRPKQATKPVFEL